jgi:hypothetical protein
MGQKLDSCENSQGDQMIPIEHNEEAAIFKVLNTNTYFVTQLETKPDFYDYQSKRYLSTAKFLKGSDKWEDQGTYLGDRTAAIKHFRDLSDPAAAARKEKDIFYRDLKKTE